MSEKKFKNNNFSKPKRKKTIKRKPGSTSKAYFDKNAEKAIIKYIDIEDLDEKGKLYKEEILPAFDSLVENLINVYGYKVSFESKRDLKSECLEFLYKIINKYDKTKGSKAFSYFNVVSKNWLTIKSKQNVKRMKTFISADEKENFTNSDLELYEAHNTIPSYEDIIEQIDQNQKIRKVVDIMKTKVKTDNEKICIEAIEQILESIDDIDILNKRAVLLYLRTISGLSNKQLSISLSSLKKKYKHVKKDLDDE